MFARTILVQGHVQGVFFREWTVGKARERGLSGWVRNRKDGRVEIYAVGDEPSLSWFIKRFHEGSPASRVDAVEVSKAEVVPTNGFVRRGTI